jgi:hypothetical protein
MKLAQAVTTASTDEQSKGRGLGTRREWQHRRTTAEADGFAAPLTKDEDPEGRGRGGRWGEE